MRYDRSSRPDSAYDLCRRLREKDDDTCARYLVAQDMWWRAYGARRCLIVGDAALRRAQGFVIDAFATVLRMHKAGLSAADVGNSTRGGNVRCANPVACLKAAADAGCSADHVDSVLTLGHEPDMPPSVRTLLNDVYRPKMGVFGGPPMAS